MPHVQAGRGAPESAQDVIEPALAHATGTATEPAYQRSDVIEKRRQLMQQWAAFIASPDRRGVAVTPTPINQARRS